MKTKKELKLENIKVVLSDQCLEIFKDFYDKNGFEKKSAISSDNIVRIDQNSIYLLKNFLNDMDETKKEISYIDKSYIEKRKLLRQLSTKDELREYLNIMTDLIWSKIKDNIPTNILDEISFYNYIKKFLVDGYLSFEIIFDDKQKNIIGINEIDVCNLSIKHDDDGKMLWVIKNNTKDSRVLYDSQIIYLSYSRLDYFLTSYIEEMKESYEKTKRLENELIYSKVKSLGGFSTNPPSLSELKRAYKKLDFVSKIPKSILKYEKKESDDIRFNSFINDKCYIFMTQMIDKLKK